MNPLPRFVVLAFCVFAFAAGRAVPNPSFTRDASVHDPSVIKVGDRYYVYGSHGASAWTTDLMNWTQVASAVNNGNPPHFPNFEAELSEMIAWCFNVDTLWAPDARQLPDGRYYYYYCSWNERGYMGLAVSDNVEGPYSDLGEIVKAGGPGFNARIHPNTVDPALFRDKTGKLWMVYGSYSGGLYIFEMDESTGFPKPGQGWGKHLMGGEHARIEAPYIVYNPDTDYYYLWTSFGGLAADGGYNIRVTRSRNPDGPYVDALGTDMATVKGAANTVFDDASIEPHGVKLMGNWQFLHVEGEPRQTSTGHVSPGHNSVAYDAASGKWFNFFHTRFVGRGEAHEVRAHQVFFNEDGWPVVAPQRYAGETIGSYHSAEVAGAYKVINHGKDISTTVKTSTVIELGEGGSIDGAPGSWTMVDGQNIRISLAGVSYRGVVCRQWDNDNRSWVNAFSALSADGAALWGSEVAIPDRALPLAAPDLAPIENGAIRPDETLRLSLVDRQTQSDLLLVYELLEGPAGARLDSETGELEWSPLATQTGIVSSFRIRAYDSIETSVADEVEFSVYVGATVQTAGETLGFDEPATGGILDSAGAATGLTARLSGTGTGYAASDPNLTLDAAHGRLLLDSTRTDFNGQAGVSATSAVGRRLSEFGYTGAEDFVVSAEFEPVVGLGQIDQVGVFVGSSATTLTRAGIIIFAAPEGLGAHTQAGVDTGATFNQSSFDLSDGLSVTIARQNGAWSYAVDGVSVNPQTPPSFLDGLSELTVGIFAINPLNNVSKTIGVKSFSAHVINDQPAATRIAQWRATHVGDDPAAGIAGNGDDPDLDGRSNLLEYAQGTDPTLGDADPNFAVSTLADALRLTFSRIDDPALIYRAEAMDTLGAAEPDMLWSSAGASNASGVVAVEAPAPESSGEKTFLRLVVEIVE